MKEIITSSNAPPPVGPYSQAVALGVHYSPDGWDGFIFLSGQVGRKPDTTELEKGVAAQTRQAILNMQAVLSMDEKKNLTLDHIVKTTVFLVNMDDFAEMNAVYAEFFDENTAPARSTIEVSRLPLDALIEIDAIASLHPRNRLHTRVD